MKTLFSTLLIMLALSAQAQVTSTFDTDTDGWRLINDGDDDTLTVSRNASGGNPGSYISAVVPTDNYPGYFWYAPAKFLGNLTYTSLGLTLTYSQQQLVTGNNSEFNGNYYEAFSPDIIIASGNDKIYYHTSPKPTLTPGWTTYTVTLDETSPWHTAAGTSAPLATRDQIKKALINVTFLAIRGNYNLTANTIGLDEVTLGKLPVVTSPTVASFSPTSGKPGTSITINGNNFDPTAANNAVYFGTIAGTITNASATQLTVTVPIGVQYGNITIINKTTGLSKKSTTPFLPTFSGGGRIIPASFSPKIDIPLSIDIEGLTIADIDGDGWSDLAVASSTAFRVIEIYRNLGSGGDITTASFAPKITVAIPGTSTNNTGLQFVDLDGDGKLDAATSNVLVTFGSAYFITFRNISTPGNIAFESAEFWSGNTDDSSPNLVADIDGDGRPELIGGEGPGWIAQNISTLGNIEFGPSIYLSTSGFVEAKIGDLDNDGKPELLVSKGSSPSQSFYILKNNSTPGTISLTNLGEITTDNHAIQIADINLDGKNDIIFRYWGGTQDIRIRVNTNSGGTLALTDFTTEVAIDGDLSTYGGLSIADINGDGKLDIIATDNADVGVFENVYAGGVFDANAFIPAYEHQGNGNSTYPTSPIIADLNGDQKSEIIYGATNTSPRRICIYQNKNIHAPVISVNTIFPLKGPVGSTVTITGNNFSLIPSENKVWFGGVEATVLTSTATLITAEVPAGATNALISVTKDGLTSRYRLPFQTTFGPGVTFDNTHFAPPVNFTLAGANYNLDIGDLNQDGKPDIIAGGTANNAYAFRDSHTTGAISNTSLIADDTIANANYPRLEDLDGDAYLDVMSVNGPLLKNSSTLTEISFLPPVNVPIGATVVDFADFNNDGKTDMTLTTDLSGTGDLIILENRTLSVPGNFVSGAFGFFSGNFVYNKPSANGAAITGDFDGDGFADIVTTNPAADNISIYRNLGVLKISQAQFATRVDVAVGDDPNRIYKGDFDSDGKLDLLVYHWTGTSTTLLIVLQNTSTVGNISFSRIDLTNPNAVTVAHIADLDGDGKPEILTTAEANNQFSIFKNLHTSGALTAASFGVPFNTTVTAPRAITTADINLDGKPEIILTRAAGLLVVYENLISPFLPPTISSFTPASGPVGTTVTITGTNFDTTPANNIVYFGATRSTVSASTTTQLTVTVPIDATYARITELNKTTNLLAYSMENFTPTFSPSKGSITSSDFEPKVDFTTGSNPLNVSIGDLDGDGKSDLAVANTASNTISVLRNTSSGPANISYATKVDFASDNDPESVSIGDFDSDGKMDLAVANYIGFSVSVFRNTSTGVGNINYAAKIDFATGFTHRASAIADFDGDGKVDIVAPNDNANSVSVLRNTSTGPGNINYAAKVDFSTGAGSGPYSISVGDVDGDEMPDVIAPNFNLSTVSILRNTSSGEGDISFAAKVDFTTGANPISVSVGDLDGDSKEDLAIVNKNSNSISVFRNISTGAGNISYAAKVDFPVGTDPRSVSIGDLDGDSKADLAIVSNVNNAVSVLHNISTGAGNISFAPKVDFATDTSPRYVSIGDSDGDGKSDIVTANASGNSVSVIRNNPVFSAPTIISFTPGSGPVGTTVTITGTNFSTTPANNIVMFNGTTATVISSTATSIVTTVPAGATTGKITVQVGTPTATSATDYTVTVASATIIINTQPVDAAICTGGMASFTLTASGTTNLTYQWQKFDGSVFSNISNTGGYSGTATSTLTINTTGNFGEGDYHCSVSGDFAASIFSQTVSLTFTTSTTVAEITANGTTLTASPGDTYQWYQNGDAIVGATTQSFEFNVFENGVYQVDVTDNGCTSTSAPYEYLITGTEDFSGGLKVYPNPVNGNIFIEHKPPYSVYIISTTGSILSKTNSNTRETSLDLSGLANGVYVLRLEYEKGMQYQLITKK